MIEEERIVESTTSERARKTQKEQETDLPFPPKEWQTTHL
jgi:hypothetical protein